MVPTLVHLGLAFAIGFHGGFHRNCCTVGVAGCATASPTMLETVVYRYWKVARSQEQIRIPGTVRKEVASIGEL